MPRIGRKVAGAAVAASAVSSARTNRAVRHSIEDQQDQATQTPAAQPEPAPATQPEPAPQAAPVAASDSVDYAAQLEELAALRDKGILTEDEFAQKKQEILAKM